MATVPGDPRQDPYGGIEVGLRPLPGDIYAAAAMHAEQTKLAGDIIQFPDKPRGMPLGATREEIKKARTLRILNQVVEPENVLPMTPRDK